MFCGCTLPCDDDDRVPDRWGCQLADVTIETATHPKLAAHTNVSISQNRLLFIYYCWVSRPSSEAVSREITIFFSIGCYFRARQTGATSNFHISWTSRIHLWWVLLFALVDCCLTLLLLLLFRVCNRLIDSLYIFCDWIVLVNMMNLYNVCWLINIFSIIFIAYEW